MANLATSIKGVRKTTVAVNLAHALTRRDQRVLVADVDSQCNATSLLLPKEPGGNTLYEVFSEPDLEIGRCVYPTEYEKLFCLPTQYERYERARTAAAEVATRQL